MMSKWLNIFFKFSGFIFSLKRKLIRTENWFKILLLASAIIVFELGFAIISFPIYIIVSPAKVQEEGAVLPIKKYETKRKISLIAFLGIGGLFLVKLIFIGVVSFYLLGGQTLLAATQNWSFNTAGNYAYDSAKIEVTGGTARLKNLGETDSGITVNPGFDTDASGWTAAPGWDNAPGKTNTASYVSSGGNPGGYADIYLDGKKGNDSAGYWHQSFTTTVNSPDTATLDLDWKSISITGAAAPLSYRLYAFIDTDSGGPANQVWDSGEISSAGSWNGISTVDIRSNVPTAGTYYLKFYAYVNCSNKDCQTMSGFDNAEVNWSKTTTGYADDGPDIYPTTSLNAPQVTAWDSFAETATKNGGEIYYQLSDDDGVTWRYWNGSAWALAGVGNYNIASVINGNIGTFSTANGKIRWKAFLEGDGTQQIIIDNIAITYTENDPPAILNLSSAQDTATGLVYAEYDLQDNETDPSDLTVYEYSLTGVFAGEEALMTASTTDPSHDGVTGLSTSQTGISHTFAWDVCADISVYDPDVYVRLRANDGISNSEYAVSSSFVVDCVNPVVSNVSALQRLGTTLVSITYDLADDIETDLNVELDISEDGGLTWEVSGTSVTGDVGTVSAGSKTIAWDAGTDFDEQEQDDMQVRVSVWDKYQNQSYASSTDFSLDTLDPVVDASADVQAQPNAGDTAVLVGGSFTEVNPNTNSFYVSLNGSYGSLTEGDADTANPSDQAVTVNALDGDDYISGVKIIHTDDYGQSVDNENTSVSHEFVKPYTPQAPTVNNPAEGTVDVQINPHSSETAGLEYLIYETSQSKYIQSDSTLGTSAFWQNSWGLVTVIELANPSYTYEFKVKSRNVSDTSNAVTSESAFSAGASSENQAPGITVDSAAQTTNYVEINYTGTDLENASCNIVTAEYSDNNLDWQSMTEKSDVGSEGVAGLSFSSGGTSHFFAWDSGTDLPDTEDSTVYVRLRANDGLAAGNLAVSSAFAVDSVSPAVSNVSAVQNIDEVVFQYDILDGSVSLVELDISEDGGSTWEAPDTSVTGDVGSGITSGSKTIAWDAGIDFGEQEQDNMQVRIRGTDAYGNEGDYALSDNFSVDTAIPVVSNVVAIQNATSTDVVVTYDLTDNSSDGHLVELDISEDGGSTWEVPDTSVTGDIGAGQNTGSSKTFIWFAGVDFSGEEQAGMRVRVRSKDKFNNQGEFAESADFEIDTAGPVILNISAAEQVSGEVSITYDLEEDALVEWGISDNGGLTWEVTTSTGAGDIGIVSAGSKTITWNVGIDFDDEEQEDMRVRLRGTDDFNNLSSFVESADFEIDTAAPLGLLALSKFSSTAGSATLNWSAGVLDANFNHYELWHGSDSDNVDNRLASEWDDDNDSALSDINTISTTITGLSMTSNYYVKIWAVDDYGNEATIGSIDVYTPSEPEPEPTPEPGEEPVSGGAGGFIAPDVTPPSQPVLSSLASPTNLTQIDITGLADPRSRIDLYDNGELISRLSSAADNDGNFSQVFSFDEGEHILTIKAVDFSNNASQFSEQVIFLVDLTPPDAPIVLNLADRQEITDSTPLIVGVSEPFARVKVIIDGVSAFAVNANNAGAWSFILPGGAALDDGTHSFVFSARDEAGNDSGEISLELTKIFSVVEEEEVPVPGVSIPSEVEIIEVTEAIELPGIPTPKITNVNFEMTGDIISFSGTALPNKDIVVYIHSDQAVVYNTKTNQQGAWVVNHSQENVELSPGEHSIFAITVDKTAKIKSQASAVSLFTIEKNLWVGLYNLLNLWTTIIALIIIIMTMMWLYRLRKNPA